MGMFVLMDNLIASLYKLIISLKIKCMFSMPGYMPAALSHMFIPGIYETSAFMIFETF